MYCAQSSKWGLFGRNTRSAIRGTSSLKKSTFFEKVPEYDSGVMNKDKQCTACDAVLIDKDGTMCRMRCGANKQRQARE